jgi:thioesterase domain-containing protein
MSIKNVEDVYALSSMQRLMLMQSLSSGQRGAFCEQLTCTLTGTLRRDVLRAAWHDVVSRHPALRTGFAWEGLKKPLQFVYREVKLPWQEHDLGGLGEDEREADWDRILVRARQGFEITKPPLLRVDLGHWQDGEHRLAWTCHHLIVDGWSLALVLEEVFGTYEARCREEPRGMPPAYPFRNYIHWLSKQDVEQAQRYWQESFAGFRPNHHLPLAWSLPPGAIVDARFDEQEVTVPADFAADLGTFAAQQHCTLGTVLAGAWGLLLGRLQNLDDVAFGMTVSGRPPTLVGAETVIGPLMNNVPLRVQLDPDERVSAWLKGLHASLAELRQFEHTSLDDVHDWLDLPDSSRLFQSLVVLENYLQTSRRRVADELEIRDLQGTVTSQLPLTLIAMPQRGLELRVRYDCSRIEPDAASGLLEHLVTILGGLSRGGEQRLADVAMLSGRQRDRLAKLDRDSPPSELIDKCSDAVRLGQLTDVARQQSQSVRWLVVDDWGQTAPIGAPGELCVVNGRPNPSADSDAVYDTAAYRQVFSASGSALAVLATGLYARRLPDGSWQWLGSVDGSVRIGDCRIDPRRAEQRLIDHPLVAEAKVATVDNSLPHPRLIAYVVPTEESHTVLDQEGSAFLVSKVRDVIGDIVPLSGVPVSVVVLSKLPRNQAGEVDVDALPLPHQSRPASAPEYVAPRDPLESQLAMIWSDLLGVHPIGIRDGFLELGGQSSLAMSLISRVESETGRKLPIVSLFGAPTIEHLADLLRRPAASAEEQSLVPIRSSGSRRPLFCVHPAGGTVFCYLEFARHLDEEQPVYGLQAVGVDGQRAPHVSIEEMAAHYVASIRTVQAQGPYAVCGWSSGGIVAFEVARQLAADGETMHSLCLFDSAIRADSSQYTQDDVLAMLLMMFPGDSRSEIDRLRGQSATEQMAYFRRRAELARLVVEGTGQNQVRFVHDVFQANASAIAAYQPRQYEGRITLFRARQAATPMHEDPYLGWGNLAAEVDVVDVGGDHVTMFREPTVRQVASLMGRVLDQ